MSTPTKHAPWRGGAVSVTRLPPRTPQHRHYDIFLNAATSCTANPNDRLRHARSSGLPLHRPRSLGRSMDRTTSPSKQSPHVQQLQTTRTLVLNTNNNDDYTILQRNYIAERLRTNIANIRSRSHSVDFGASGAGGGGAGACKRRTMHATYLQTKMSPALLAQTSKWAQMTKVHEVNELLCDGECSATFGVDDTYATELGLRRSLSFPDVSKSNDIVFTCCPCLCYNAPEYPRGPDIPQVQAPPPIECACGPDVDGAGGARGAGVGGGTRPAPGQPREMNANITAEILNNDIRMVNSTEFLICENIMLQRSMPLTVCELRQMIGEIPMCRFCKANLADIAGAITAHRSVCDECNQISFKQVSKKAVSCSPKQPPIHKTLSCQASIDTRNVAIASAQSSCNCDQNTSASLPSPSPPKHNAQTQSQSTQKVTPPPAPSPQPYRYTAAPLEASTTDPNTLSEFPPHLSSCQEVPRPCPPCPLPVRHKVSISYGSSFVDQASVKRCVEQEMCTNIKGMGEGAALKESSALRESSAAKVSDQTEFPEKKEKKVSKDDSKGKNSVGSKKGAKGAKGKKAAKKGKKKGKKG